MLRDYISRRTISRRFWLIEAALDERRRLAPGRQCSLALLLRSSAVISTNGQFAQTVLSERMREVRSKPFHAGHFSHRISPDQIRPSRKAVNAFGRQSTDVWYLHNPRPSRIPLSSHSEVMGVLDHQQLLLHRLPVCWNILRHSNRTSSPRPLPIHHVGDIDHKSPPCRNKHRGTRDIGAPATSGLCSGFHQHFLLRAEFDHKPVPFAGPRTGESLLTEQLNQHHRLAWEELISKIDCSRTSDTAFSFSRIHFAVFDGFERQWVLTPTSRLHLCCWDHEKSCRATVTRIPPESGQASAGEAIPQCCAHPRFAFQTR